MHVANTRCRSKDRTAQPAFVDNMPPAMETSSCFNFGGIGERKVPLETEDDAFLAKELNALSMQEREKVYEEVHGVNEVVDENPAFISEKIVAIKAELAKLSVTKRRAFDRAVFLKPGLENDEKMHLMFLRSESFDATAAAQRLCLHFEHKLELFGEAKLPKKITLDDLDEDDLAIFRTECHLVLPKRDRSGRLVQIINIPRMEFKDWRNMVRYTWYNVFNLILADEETQRKGTVDVMYFVDMHKVPTNMLNYVRDSHHILSAMPNLTRGFHVCYNNGIIRSFLSFLHVVMNKERRLRERLHFGSHLEIQYELCSYGINVGDLGSDLNTPQKRKRVDRFLRERRDIEAKEKQEEMEREKATGLIAHPSSIDVLCGRGRPYQDFPGNIRLGLIVDEHVSLYIETTERAAKTMIAMDIVRKIQNDGGRFLSRTNNGWEMTTDKVARAKISQALRVRALKRIRGETSEPLPIKQESSHDAPSSRDSKRMKFSPEEISDEDDFALIDFEQLEGIGA